MIDLKKLQSLIQRKPEQKDYPKHVIVNLFPIEPEEEGSEPDFRKLISILYEIIDAQKEKNIPIVTINLGNKGNIDQKALYEECGNLLKKAIGIKARVTFFGRWYDLEGQLVEEIKRLNNETNDFDYFFLNICINYSSQQEIADASRVIIRKILQNKMDIDSITPETFKENVYSSYFIPPDLIIEPDERFRGTFLWDSPGAVIVQLNKKVLDITKQDFVRAVEKYSEKNNKKMASR